MARFDKKDFEGARLAFLQAYAVLNKTDILFNLAYSELKTGHEVDALRHLEQYASDPNADADVRKKFLPGLLEQARKATGHVRLELPPGASVRLDGQPVQPELLGAGTVHVTVGHHTFEGMLGSHTQKIEVEARPGEVNPVRFDQLVEQPLPVPSASSSSSVPVPVPSASSSASPVHPEPDFWNGRRAAGAVVAGVAIASFGVALASSLVAASKGDDAATFRSSNGGACFTLQSAACLQYGSIVDSRNTALDVEHGFLIGGAVLGVAGAVLLLWPRSSESSSQAWIAPSVGPREAGLRVQGSF